MYFPWFAANKTQDSANSGLSKPCGHKCGGVQGEDLEDRKQQLVSSVLRPAKLVLAELAQQLQIWAAIGELILVLVHLGVLVRFDDGSVGKGVRHIPVLAQACASACQDLEA